MPLHLFRLTKSWNWAYILGELLLITLGVLFALAINNWNNRKEETKKEAFHLQDLQQSLRSDHTELRNIISFHEEGQRSCDILYHHLLAGKSWNDSVPKWLEGTANVYTFFPQRAAFENLKSLDFNLIKNDQLRASIFQTYEERFEQLKESEQILIKRIEELWIPLLSTKIEMSENYSIKPVDYTKILQEPPYRNCVGLLHGDHERIVSVAKITAMEAALLIRQIELELQKIKSGKRRTQELRSVTIQLAGFPDAKKVVVAGTFNEWHHTKDTLHKNKDSWQRTLKLKPGVYMYRFIVDGNWIEDPANQEKVLSEYDNFNSILMVK